MACVAQIHQKVEHYNMKPVITLVAVPHFTLCGSVPTVRPGNYISSYKLDIHFWYDVGFKKNIYVHIVLPSLMTWRNSKLSGFFLREGGAK